MAKTETSQSQQKTPAFPTFPGMDAFLELGKGWAERMNGLYEEVARMETQAIEQAHGVIDQAGSLMKDGLDYSLKLQAEWRKMALETSRRFTDSVRA